MKPKPLRAASVASLNWLDLSTSNELFNCSGGLPTAGFMVTRDEDVPYRRNKAGGLQTAATAHAHAN